jgi:hypothetical protein
MSAKDESAQCLVVIAVIFVNTQRTTSYDKKHHKIK